jgi:UDP-N-acetylmuramoyl-L-alanyl-D-glutamate--2,6-diaminopimelate ligase
VSWWQAIEGVHTVGDVPDVSDLTHDSRRVRPGTAFAAISGGRADGHDYIETAVGAGASAVVVQADHEAKWAPFASRVALVVVPDTRQALGWLAAAVHGVPSAKMFTVGVTGTDGKTTTAHLTGHVLDTCAGTSHAGYLSSVAFDFGDGAQLNRSHMTTVESSEIQRMLGQAVTRGLKGMVVEASSEGLAQGRLNGCIFDTAVFTNLTRDHLDFHGTMEQYRADKGRLFEMLDAPNDKPYRRLAVLNAGDANSEYFRTRTRKAAVVTYGFEGGDYQALEAGADGFTMRFTLKAEGQTLEAMVPLIGRFNVLNAMAAVAVAHGQDVPLAQAVKALASFPGIPGRLERIEAGQAFSVYVDIASTPAALENVLQALRPATSGKLWVVFGAAGGRDPARRTGMAGVAGRLADRFVLTNEDPRDEDPEAIIEAIAGGLRDAGMIEGRDYTKVTDRRQAIAYAFEHAEPGDTVLLAGKATEPTMVIAGRDVSWDEREVARELLKSR